MEIILICLFVCHWLCDYTPLSTKWMLDAKRIGTPLYPIFVHAFIHASFMLVTLSLFGASGLKLAILFLFQLFTHFVIDVLKGKMNVWFPIVSNPANKSHWVIFGLDQLLHSIVIVIMVYILFNY